MAISPIKYSDCTWKRSESSKSATNRKKCDTKISKLSKVHGQKWTLDARVCHKNKSRNGILLPKLFWPTVRKNCSSNQEKKLKFKAEGREFAKILRSLEQFV